MHLLAGLHLHLLARSGPIPLRGPIALLRWGVPLLRRGVPLAPETPSVVLGC